MKMKDHIFEVRRTEQIAKLTVNVSRFLGEIP